MNRHLSYLYKDNIKKSNYAIKVSKILRISQKILLD